MKNSQEALIIVDFQNDFAHIDWNLSVNTGRFIAPYINTLAKKIKSRAGLILASRDWHPENHISFASRFDIDSFDTQDGEIKWPDHCKAWSWWAEYFEGLQVELIDREVRKGFKKNSDSYSAFGWKEFIENIPTKTLEEILKETHTKIVHIVWLATDYCVGATALDAQSLWFEAIVHLPGVRAVDTDTEKQMLEKMQEHGIKILKK
jgi:nicotinamidase/pyrazinamidase